MNELARESEMATQSLRFHRQQTKPGMVQISEFAEIGPGAFREPTGLLRIAIQRDFGNADQS
jgi:hypothetical protein